MEIIGSRSGNMGPRPLRTLEIDLLLVKVRNDQEMAQSERKSHSEIGKTKVAIRY